MRIVRLGFLIAALLLAACEPPGETAVEVKEDRRGGAVEVSVGRELVVNLQGNPTTGFEWEVASVDQAILEQVGNPEFRPDSAATGSGGRVRTRFRALVPGRTTLKMIYRQPWDTNREPLETYEITVDVRQR